MGTGMIRSKPNTDTLAVIYQVAGELWRGKVWHDS